MKRLFKEKDLPFFFIFLTLALGACQQKTQETTVKPHYTPRQLAARFPADLGPDWIDISNYPAEQKKNYQTLKTKCSHCHSLARVINSDLVVEGDFARFVERMHGRSEQKYNVSLLDAESADHIIDFLVFDAFERKLKKPETFKKQRRSLEQRFEAIQKERVRIQNAKAQEKAKSAAPYVGDRP